MVKPFDVDKLVSAIKSGLELDARQVQTLARQQQCRNRLKTLRPRELEAYLCLARGHGYSEMMQALGISLPTAKTYRAAVMRKLDFATLAELIAFDRELNGEHSVTSDRPIKPV